METNQQVTTKIITFNENESEFPFAIIEVITQDEEIEVSEYKIALGNTIVDSATFDSLESAKNYINSKPYSLILALFCHCIEMKSRFEQEQQKLKENETHN